MASTTVRHYELSHNSSPLLPEGGTDDFEFRRRLGNDKERVWWAAVSKSQSIEVTIQKMTGVDLVTHRDVLTMASVALLFRRFPCAVHTKFCLRARAHRTCERAFDIQM